MLVPSINILSDGPRKINARLYPIPLGPETRPGQPGLKQSVPRSRGNRLRVIK